MILSPVHGYRIVRSFVQSATFVGPSSDRRVVSRWRVSPVRSYGTESRVTEGHIPGSDKIFDFVCFRGQDIKDLHVHDVETEVRNGRYEHKGQRNKCNTAFVACSRVALSY